MTEVKTIGDYINALPDEIREEVRSGFIQENLFLESDPLTEEPLKWLVNWTDKEWLEKWEALSEKYTLTEKEGKYYTNW